ncbi:MAG: transglycosylase domain-containing protein, partial [Anaerovoracaceae bacterium]
AAMTIIDNETGYVKAMAGGRKVNGRMILNRAVATRQSGSSIKPLTVYSAALQKSFELEAEGKTFPLTDSEYGFQGDDLWGNYLTAASIIDDEPTTVNGKKWPVNSPAGYNGLLTMRRALQKSLNICAVKIMQQTGTDYCFDLAEKYGLTTLIREGDVNDNNLAALALGGQSKGVTTLEMASAYTTFVNDGVHKSYNVYTKVTTRNGDILLEADTTENEVLDPGVAWIMRDMLQSDITEGIAGAAAVSGAKAGGKTGTTSDQFDIWFDGFTAKYSAALWIGSDINIKLSSMSGTAARLWGRIMNQIPGVASGTYSAKPSNVISVSIDTKSGLLATEASGSDVRTEYFTKGTQPTETSTLHQTMDVCSESGYQATPSCPDVETKSGILRPYTPNKRVADIERELPHYYCNLHNPDPNVYKVKKGLEVTIVQPGELTEPEDPGEGEDLLIPDDPDEPIPDNPVTPVIPDDTEDQGEDSGIL